MTAKTRTNFKSGKDTTFADNTAGDISAADLRSEMDHVADSALFPEDLAAVAADIIPDADGTRDIGSASNRFAEVHTDALYIGATEFAAATLADPGADRMLFWDDSESEVAFLQAGTGLAITTTSIAIDSTVATLTGSQTLTNKTLTAPVLGTPASGTLTNCTGYPAATTSASGIVEVAIASEVNTGTDTARAVSPDALAGSYAGTKEVAVCVFESDEAVATGDGTQMIPIPASMNGMNIVSVRAVCHTQGVTGATDVQVRRRRAGSNADVLSTKVTLGAEYTVADGVINASNDDLATGDALFIDVDAVHSGTAPNGLSVVIEARLP